MLNRRRVSNDHPSYATALLSIVQYLESVCQAACPGSLAAEPLENQNCLLISMEIALRHLGQLYACGACAWRFGLNETESSYLEMHRKISAMAEYGHWLKGVQVSVFLSDGQDEFVFCDPLYWLTSFLMDKRLNAVGVQYGVTSERVRREGRMPPNGRKRNRGKTYAFS